MDDKDKLIQEQQRQIDKLKKENTALKKEVEKCHEALNPDEWTDTTTTVTPEDTPFLDATDADKDLSLRTYVKGDTWINEKTIKMLVRHNIISRSQACIIYAISQMQYFDHQFDRNLYASYERIGKPFRMSKDSVIKAVKRHKDILGRERTGVINRNGHVLWRWYAKR
jgi:hypothetical protein